MKNEIKFRSDAREIRKDFPFFQDNAKSLHYLDSAATSQKPQVVIDALTHSYTHENANVHRGIYSLSEAATKTFEEARQKTALFVGDVDAEQVIFTSGTTMSINLIARSLGEYLLKAGDEIVLTEMEHHANIVSWQILAKIKGLKIRYIPLREDLRLDLEAGKKLFNEKTKILAFAHVSNVLGVVNPVRELCDFARSMGVISVVDGAQGAAHFPLDVKALGCDFYAFSAHKIFGPTGLGVLYGRRDLLEEMPPLIGGGEMIEKVNFLESTFKPIPHKFEAGTLGFNQVAAWAAAIDYLKGIDRIKALAHERSLGKYLYDYLSNEAGWQVFVHPGEDWIGIVSCYHKDIHPHDLAFVADSHQVAIRAGNHCAQPLMSLLKVPATLRVSPSIYSLKEDVDAFIKAMESAKDLFKG